jgi:glycosyltransferase involved in cell wall biosynthesis
MLLEVNSPLYAERKKYSGIAADFLARWAEHMVWREADYVLPVTHVLADLVKQTGIGEEKVLVISNAVNPRRFNRAWNTERAKAWLGLQNEIVLGFVGFMREWHGLERVIDLLAESEDRDRHLLLVGDGPARQGLEELAQRRGISDKVTITGVIARDNVASYIAAFDIALQPNVVGYASPLKLFEYMALGRAIVAPSTSNIKEVLDHGENAILFNPDDYEDFANAIETACRDRMLRDKISRAARKTILDRRLTWANNAKKVADLFSCLVAKQAV